MSRLVACLIVRAFAADLDPYHLFQLGSAVRLGACGAAVEDDELVVFGGQFNDESVYYQDTLRFAINNSPRRFTASRVSQNLPERRQGAAMVPYDHNNLWLAGGSLGGFLLDGVMMFDTNLEIWMAGFPLESKKIPPREFHAATTTGDGKLLMWGGLGKGSRLYNDLHSVQMVGPETFMGDVVFPYRVEDLPQSGQVPTGRIKGSLTYVEGYLVLIGGISSDGLEQCDIHVFDLTESVWLKLNLPTNPSEKGLPIVTQNGKCFGKRQGHTAVRHGHSIYLIGGCNTEAKDYFCYDDLWQLTFTFDKQKLVSIRIQDRKQHPLNTGMQQVSAVLMKKQGLNHLPVLVQATGTGRGIEPSEEGVPYYLKTVVGRNLPLCADACSGHGWCDKGYCRCEAGFQGHDCGLVATAGLGNEAAGVCNYQGLMAPTGRCHCFHGYRGQFCQYGWAMCPGDCSGHGTCTHQARCDCSHGWEGLDCSVRARCPLECCNHGECSTEGKCDCFEGYFGLSCAISLTDRMGLQTAAQEAVDRLIQLAAAKDKESAEHETVRGAGGRHAVGRRTAGCSCWRTVACGPGVQGKENIRCPNDERRTQSGG